MPGSPPRMRGKRTAVIAPVRPVGITPAHAGKTFKHTSFPHSEQDHPRACGENEINFATSRALAGSPPRMRGKQNGKKKRTRLRGITPAHAGKTVVVSYFQCVLRDHPRACGENKPIWDIAFLTIGSPPRMRGKRAHARQQGGNIRITPAHAGKTLYMLWHLPTSWDHPRACGENPD